MTPKEILTSVLRIDQEIETLNRARDRLREEETYLSATDYSKVIVMSTTGRGSTEQIALQMADIDGKLCQAVERLWKAKARAEALISTLKSSRHRDLMRRRYLLCESWEQVAYEMHYGYRHVLKMHGAALEELKRNMAHNGT